MPSGMEIPQDLSTGTEHDLQPHQGEDLREHYITPFYLETMSTRLGEWTDEHLRRQFDLFRRTLPGYPEVLEILEGELHRRSLNKLKSHARRAPHPELDRLLQRYGSEPDFREVIETELELRKGVSHLHDASGET